MKHAYTNHLADVFPGYYNTQIGEVYEIDNVKDGYYLDFKNFKKYTAALNEYWVEMIERNLIENPIGMKIFEYVSMYSPREYNFGTDRITFNVEVNLNQLKEYCWKTCKEEFDKYLHDNWSSCSGFISFIPDNVSAFINKYKEDKENLIDIMIEFYLLQNVDFENVESNVVERLYELQDNFLWLRDKNGPLAYDYQYNEKEDYIEPILTTAF